MAHLVSVTLGQFGKILEEVTQCHVCFHIVFAFYQHFACEELCVTIGVTITAIAILDDAYFPAIGKLLA